MSFNRGKMYMYIIWGAFRKPRLAQASWILDTPSSPTESKKSSIWQVPAGFGSESKFSKKVKYVHKSTFLTEALNYLFAFVHIVKMLFQSTNSTKLEPYLCSSFR